MKRIKWSILMVLGVLIYSCQLEYEEAMDTEDEVVSSLPFYNDRTFTPEWKDTIQENSHVVGAFSFLNQYNENVTEKNFKGKVYLTNFFFTKCGGICPKMMANMEQVANEFKGNDEVKFLSHSVTPDVDTPEQLLGYTSNFEIQKGKWHLVTGNRSEIYDMAINQYFAEREEKNPEALEFLHTEHFILVDQNRRIRGIYNGTVALEMQRIIDDINLLLL